MMGGDGAGQKGKVYRKGVGVFSDRETRVEMLKIEVGGRLSIAPEDATQLFFVLKGNGQVNGEDWDAGSAMRLEPGEEGVLTSDGSIELLRFVLPTLPDTEKR
jgi:hypothetical protein